MVRQLQERPTVWLHAVKYKCARFKAATDAVHSPHAPYSIYLQFLQKPLGFTIGHHGLERYPSPGKADNVLGIQRHKKVLLYSHCCKV